MKLNLKLNATTDSPDLDSARLLKKLLTTVYTFLFWYQLDCLDFTTLPISPFHLSQPVANFLLQGGDRHHGIEIPPHSGPHDPSKLLVTPLLLSSSFSRSVNHCPESG